MKRVMLTALLCISATAAFGEEPDSSQPVTAAQAFVTKATQAGLAEIELGKLAQTRSSDPKVKEFAATMVQDHTQANADLSAIAKRKNLNVPTSLDDKHATMVHAVSTKPPSEFDAEYSRQMVDAHDAAATLFSDGQAVGDKDIAGFAKKTLTTIHRHQQLAATLPAKPHRPDPAGPGSTQGSESDTPSPLPRATGAR
jgi:predicted outer membrane protein